MRTRRSVPGTGSTSVDRGSGDAGLAGRHADAVGHLADGRAPRAATVFEAVLADCRELLGADHPETLVVEGNLAVARVVAGQEEAGARLMTANLAARERVFGDEHALTLTARDAVATTHRLAGRLTEALWLYSRVAPQRNRVLGPSHPDTLTTRLGLGLTFAETGDTAMAVDVVTAALQDCGPTGIENEHATLLRDCLSDLRGHEVPAVAEVPVPRPRRAPAVVRGRARERTAIDIGSGADRGGGP